MQRYKYKVIVRSRAIISALMCVNFMLFFSVVAAFVDRAHFWAGAGVCIACVALDACLWLFWPKEFYLALGFTQGVGRDWKRACQLVGLMHTVTGSNGSSEAVPHLVGLEGNKKNWRACVSYAKKMTPDELNKYSESIAQIMGVGTISFRWGERGSIIVNACTAVLPVITPSVVAEPVQREEIVTHWQMVSEVPVAVTATGEPFKLSVTDNHILLVGASGGGKSSWVWSIVMGLAPAVQAGVVKLWACDPKLVELNKARVWWDEYAKSTDGMIELIARFHDEMMVRADVLGDRGDDHYVISPDEPLNVLIIDELADLLTGVDKKKTEAVLRPLTAILRKGRAIGYVVLGASQSAKVDAVPCRDDFITRVGLRMMSASHVDMLLGLGAREAGAHCWLIPAKGAAGTAYVLGEDGVPVMARAHYWTKEDIRRTGEMMRESAVQVAGSSPVTDELAELIPAYNVE